MLCPLPGTDIPTASGAASAAALQGQEAQGTMVLKCTGLSPDASSPPGWMYDLSLL